MNPHRRHFNLNLELGQPISPVEQELGVWGTQLCAARQGQARLEAPQTVKELGNEVSCPSWLGSGWPGSALCLCIIQCDAFPPPLPFSCLPASPPLFIFFLHLFFLLLSFPFTLSLSLSPLWAPPLQLLWQQLNARNTGRIQLGHQFPKQHPRVGRRRARATEQTTGQGPGALQWLCVYTLEGGAGQGQGRA